MTSIEEGTEKVRVATVAVSCSEAAVAAAATGGARLESFPVVEVNTYRLWRAGQELVCEALFPEVCCVRVYV